MFSNTQVSSENGHEAVKTVSSANKNQERQHEANPALFDVLELDAPLTQSLKYTGSKLKLIPQILRLVKRVDAQTVLDGFSGTTRVSQALAKCGYTVLLHNTRKLDAIREGIEVLKLNTVEKAVVLTSLMLALNRVDTRLVKRD